MLDAPADDGVATVISKILADATTDVLVVNPDTKTGRELLRQLRQQTTPTSVKLLATTDVLDDLVEDFLVASVLADLLHREVVDVRTDDELPHCSLCIDESTVTSIIAAGDQRADVATDDAAIVEQFREFYDAHWETIDAYPLRTPPLSAILESLHTDIGSDVATEFETILESRDAVVKGDDEYLGEVTIALLAAARNGVLQYDISEWGKDAGFASTATFSRTKSRLEEAGVLTTESVPIEVGRPRLRLLLKDDLVGLSPTELADEVQGRLERD